jgi:glycosyl transferase, family 25
MWPSLVINLARNTVRMDNAARALTAQGIPFARLDAVNGFDLPPDEVARVYDADANRRRGRAPLVGAEIGCYLSHIQAWRQIAAGDAPGGFIFEDDFDAGADLADVLRLLSDDGGRDWDMVKLFSFDTAPATIAGRALGPRHRIVIPDRVPTCLIGYGVTRAAAAHLESRAIPFFRPVDEDQKFFWETGLRNALVLPPPVRVGDQQTVTGTIGVARRTAAKAIPRRPFHTLRYQIGYRLALARANRARRRGS